MNNYNFVEIDDKNKWQSLLTHFSDSNLYHEWNYSRIVQGEKDIKHIALYFKDELISVFQIRFKTIPYVKRGIAYIYKGPIWQKKNNSHPIDTFKNLLLAIKYEYVINQKLCLWVRPFLYSHLFSEMLTDIEVKTNFNIIGPIYNTLLLELNRDISEIRKALKSNWRNHLNKAENNSLRIIKGTDQKLSNEFVLLYQEMITRKKFVTNIDLNAFIEFIKSSEVPSKPKIIIAYKDNQPVSGIIFSCIGQTGISIFRATNKIGMKTNASYLVQFETIKWLKEMSAGFYDLGGIDPINNPGVYEFKSGITNNNVSDLGIFESSKDIISKLLVNMGEYIYNTKNRLRNKSLISELFDS